jgi:hypothetical protein
MPRLASSEPAAQKLSLTHAVGRGRPIIVDFDQLMAAFHAEMWHVDDCRWISRQELQQSPRRDRFQLFAQLQDWQGAQKPSGIDQLFIIHFGQAI